MEGYGKYTFDNGNGSYIGERKTSQKHGHGLYTYKDGATYNGEWVNDVKHGYGVYTWASGKVRKGIWKNNVEWDD